MLLDVLELVGYLQDVPCKVRSRRVRDELSAYLELAGNLRTPALRLGIEAV